MKKTLILLLQVVLAVRLAAGVTPEKPNMGDAAGQAQTAMAPRFQVWLDMVNSIASDDEKQVFMKLQNDRDRDTFIGIFWQQRDPTPGTAQNEYQDEIAKRFEYVNRRFGRGSSRPGWLMDMGRYYMILGEPRSIERFDENPELFPVQVWYYSGDGASGLPSYFNITFFRPRGAGDWKLYNPSLDGPAALLNVSRTMDESNYSTIMAKISQIAPTLTGPALSMIPNDTENENRPSLRNSLILGRIAESPIRMINPTYATNFLNYKGFVDIESSVNYIESTGLVALAWEPRFNSALVEFSLKPKKISLAYDTARDQYYLNLKLNVSLRQQEKVIYQYVKNFELSFAPDRVDALQKSGVVIHDVFPVAPGRFQVMIFIENSVSKEFYYFDRSLDVPAASNLPLLATPLVGFKSEEQHDPLFFAFRFGDRKLFLDPEALFGMEETPIIMAGVRHVDRGLWEKGRIEMEVLGLNERAPFRLNRAIALRDHPYAETMNLFLPLDGMRFPPDYYRVILRLYTAGGVVAAVEESKFSVSPLPLAAHPVESYKALSVLAPFQFEFICAMQYESLGALAEADALFTAALEHNPGFVEGRLKYLRLQNRMKNFEKTLAASEPLRGNDKAVFDFHALRGAAFFGLGRTDEALAELVAANQVYNSDFRVLNLIGFACLKKNNDAEALKAFAASLALVADQPEIAKIVAGLRGQKE
jgi:GWxTD domain-containing protein